MSKGMMLVLLALLALAGMALQKSEPEIRRYMKIRSM
jgi:uncharacterized protein DUF6893